MHLKAYNYSQIEEHLPLMPTQLIGSIAALLTTYHEKEHSFLRAQEVVRLLVNAYWTNDSNSILKAKKIANSRSPPICPLIVHGDSQEHMYKVDVDTHSFHDFSDDSSSDEQSSTTSFSSSSTDDDFEL